MTESGYIIENYSENGYILTRKNGIYSNYFIVINGSPVFESMLYVNKTTKKIIEKILKKRGKN